MCLVVLYGINKKADIKLMEKMFYMQFDVKPMVNEFELVGEGLENYNFYNVGACNCNSYITKLWDAKVDTFEEYYQNLKQEHLARLENLKKLRENPKYEKLIAKFKKEFEKRRKEMQKYSVNDKKKMESYQKWWQKNQVFRDDILGGLVNDNCNHFVETALEQLIEENVVFDYERDTSIIDGVLTLCEDIIILPIWQDGVSSYSVSYKDIYYDDLSYNTLGALEMFKGVRINK